MKLQIPHSFYFCCQRLPYKLINKALLLFVLTAPFNAAYAGKDAGEKKKNNIPAVAAQPQTLADIEQYLVENEIFDYAGYEEEFFDDYNSNNPAAEEVKGKARTAMADLAASGNYIDYLTPSDINVLPVGMKKRVGNTQVIIAVSSVTFTTQYAELDLFAKMIIPQNVGGNSNAQNTGNNEIFFGVKGLKLSNTGGIIGNAKIVLLGDVAIPLPGGKGALVLKGSIDQQSGAFTDLTYINMDCSGFKELAVSADVTFPRTMLTPVNAAGEIIMDNNVLVKGSFTTTVSGWNDITAGISLTPFQIKGLKDFNFRVTNAYFDFSDTRNEVDGVGIIYPPGYMSKYISQSAPQTWRGVYISQLQVELPKAFKTKDSEARITFGAQNMIIDNNGISGNFYALNILSIDQGSASGWKFGVDSIRLALEANQIVRAGFGGQIAIPVAQSTRLAYSAVITSSSDYVIRVTNKDTLDFGVFAAKAQILPNSYVTMKVVNNVFKPEAMLHGSMGIYINKRDASDVSNTAITSFKGVKFQSLLLKTDAPRFSAQYFGYDGEVKFANFPVSLSNINLTTPAANEVSLNFTAALDLEDSSFGASTTLGIVGRWEDNTGIQSLHYDHINISAISLYADKGQFKMRGSLAFLRNDPVYGDGFGGAIKATFKLKDTIQVDVKALFGRKDFRYWFFDGAVDLGSGVGAGFNIHGFGGGAWYRMKKETAATSAFTNTGIEYVPDSTAGIGVRAAILFNIGSPSAVDGKASFEIAFNRGGGVRYVGIYGFVKAAGKLPLLGTVANTVKDQFKKIEDKMKSVSNSIADEESIIRKKMFQPNEAAKQYTALESVSSQVGITAYAGILYTSATSTLNANFDIYINAAGGLLKGTASDNRAGWAKILISPQKWYMHMGTPTDRIGLRIGIGSFNVQTSGYMMIGYDVPDNLPPLPSNVSSILGQYQSSSNPGYIKNTATANEIQSGRGFAFGAGINVSTGDMNIAIFYARVDAGAGFDLLVREKDDCHCEGQSDPIGINGWYMSGQAYAYFQADVGIRIKIGPFKKKISILKAGVAALVQAQMPNPTWVLGQVAGYYSILGGIIRGNFNIRFRVGNACRINCEQLEDILGEDSLNKTNLITSLAPANGTDKVPVTPILSAAFELPLNTEMADDLDDQSKTKIVLESVKLVRNSNNTQMQVASMLSNDKRTLTVELTDPSNKSRLWPLENYTFEVKVAMQEWKNNSWVPVMQNGTKFIQTRSVSFTSNAYPESIKLDDVAYSWPVIGQSNFFKGETANGYIKLKTHVADLFASFVGNGTTGSMGNYFAEFTSTSGHVSRSPIQYDGDKLITYQLPDNLSNGAMYNFKIMGRNVGFSREDSKDFSKYTQSGGVVAMPAAIAILGEVQISDEVDAEIKNMLRSHKLSDKSIDFFLRLEEQMRISFLIQAGFSETEIYDYVNIRTEVISRMLTARGYSSGIVRTYIEELNKTVTEQSTYAVMATNEESQKPVIDFNFRCSNYNTFSEKMNNLQVTQHIIGRLSTDVINLQAEVSNYEGFDKYDLRNITTNTGALSTVQNSPNSNKTIDGAATFTDSYYQNTIGPMLYSNTATTDLAAGGVIVSSYYVSCLQTGANNNFVNRRFPFIYNHAKLYNEDFLRIRREIINGLNSPPKPGLPPSTLQNLSRQQLLIVSEPFPFMNPELYPVQFQYRLPDNSAGTSGTFNFKNDIQ